MDLSKLRKRKQLLAKADDALTEMAIDRQVDRQVARLMHRPQGAHQVDRVEMDRILALPFCEELGPEDCEEFSRGILLATAFQEGRRLFPTQVSAVAAYMSENGALNSIGVGFGKTGIGLMCAQHAYDKGLERVMLLIEPGTLTQLVKTDIPMWRSMTNLSIPFIVVGGRSSAERRRLYRARRRGCYIVPYSLLSTKDALDMLEGIDPDLVVADECQNLRDRSTARVKRWMAMMESRERELVAMSGTITSKSIEDYRHLASLALKDRSPLPQYGGMANAWCEVLDSGATIANSTQVGPLMPLLRWAQQHNPSLQGRTVSDFREAFNLRRDSAPGVVASGDAEVKAAISIENKAPDGRPWVDKGEFWTSSPGWDKLEDLIDQVQQAWLTPNGDEIEHSIHIFKWMMELSSGFYNQLTWPTVEQTKKKYDLKIAPQQAIDMARDTHALQQAYHKGLRWFFETSPAGMDTPMEVARIINQHPEQLPEELVNLYQTWHQAIDETVEECGVLIEREKSAVRVCPFKVDAAVEWAKAQKGGIIWVWNIEMGLWATDALTEAGLDPLYCPAGQSDLITHHFNPEGTGSPDRIAVASIRSHGVGKNLQRAPAQLFLQWPRDATKAEQALGRVHRSGVEEYRDTVRVNTLNLLEHDHILMGACLVDTVYQHQSDSRRKAIYGSWDPLPRIFSPEFLRARGSDVKSLDSRQRDMLSDKFGSQWHDRM